jgi:transglutaminase-like putative cysteine protease
MNNQLVLKPESSNLSDYLAASEIIDYKDSRIQTLGDRISNNTNSEIELALKLYEYVRDAIAHSWDIRSSVVTYKASQVLQHGHGLCFAKSHLLAALLRYLNIPTGFCYQKLVFDDENPGCFTLHGLNAIYLESLKKWIRVDARGNKPGVQAEFSLDREVLAFPIRTDWHEIDFPIIFARPDRQVIDCLQREENLQALIYNLPENLNTYLIFNL